jgi:hypothetical protein
MDKLHITNEMANFDAKNRNFFDELTDEERKKFGPYLMIRWGSTVNGSYELESYYLLSTNERLNKHFFDISGSKHKKFQWLLATTVSPGMGKQYHKWLSFGKRATVSKSEKFLREVYPHLKDDEIKTLAAVNSDQELRALAEDLGWDKSKIKEYFK